MIAPFADLFAHQAWADAELLQAITAHPPASQDGELCRLVQHVYLVQQYYLGLMDGSLTAKPAAPPVPSDVRECVPAFAETHRRLREYVGTLNEEDLSREVHMPFFKDWTPRVSEMLLQVLLHSQGHRSQCATQLRQLGGKAPTTDFILWASRRPEPVWSAAAHS